MSQATKAEHDQRIQQISRLIILKVQEARHEDGHGLQQQNAELTPPRSRARGCNSFIISPPSATTATVSDATTVITTEVRHDGPRH